MKDTIDKIKEKYAKNKLEILLMCVFVCLFFVVSGPGIAREASVLYTPEKETAQEQETDTEYQIQTEYETETETERETETETETAAPLSEAWSRALRRTLARFGRGFYFPMATPELQGEAVYYELKDQKELHGYELRTLDEEGSSTDSESPVRTISLLETMIQNEIDGYDGVWSVYVKNLGTDESFVINDRPMKSASVMKLFIMGAVYKAFETGELERTDEIMALVSDMITYSDNADSNQLLYLLGDSSYEQGIARVDEFIEEYGFSDMTVEYNGFNDPATNTGTGNFNQVSAKDCGKLLEDIYRRSWVNRAVSNEMESLLLAQNTRYKIPAGLPEGVLCGNKTGEMDTTENDAAIIFAQECDYILVVLSSDWGSKDQAIERIQSLSSMTYEFLN